MINTVKELIEELEKLKPEARVLIENNWGEIRQVVHVEETAILGDEDWIPCVVISEV